MFKKQNMRNKFIQSPCSRNSGNRIYTTEENPYASQKKNDERKMVSQQFTEN